jgi:large conductance mechanosensitive channel
MDMNSSNKGNALTGATDLVNQFFDFLKQFGVVGLAIGVVVGGAVKEYVDAIVSTMVDPIVKSVLYLLKFSPTGGIEITAGNQLQFGALISATINFLVLMVIVFIAVKFFINKFMHESDKAATGVK